MAASMAKEKKGATLPAAPAIAVAIGAAAATLFAIYLNRRRSRKKRRDDENDPLARPWLQTEKCVVIADLATLASSTTSTSSRLVVADLSGKSLRALRLEDLAGATYAKLGDNPGLELAAASVPAPPLARPAPAPRSRGPALEALRSLDLSRCALEAVPGGLASACPNLLDLDLSHNELRGCLGASEGGRSGGPFPPSLLRLNAQGNRALSSVDASAIAPLTNLVLLGLKSCSLESLPGPALGKLRRLRELYVTDNKLSRLPPEIGECESLVKLQASFNDLVELPLEELSRLPRLEMLRAAACRISELPLLEEIVFGQRSPSPSSTPSPAPFRSLCWVSLAGNPAFERCVPGPRPEAARVFHLDDIMRGGEEGEKLGSGASGDVVAVRVLDGTTTRALAFKRFRGDAGPDGRAADEVSVARAVGHGALASTVGTVLLGGRKNGGEREDEQEREREDEQERVREDEQEREREDEQERERGGRKKGGRNKGARNGDGATAVVSASPSTTKASSSQLPVGLLLELLEGKPLADKPRGDPLLRCTWPSSEEEESDEGERAEKKKRRMSARGALVAAARLASALDHLHSGLRCSHGDFYAHNVLCDIESDGSSPSGRATLVDFGASFFYGTPSRSSCRRPSAFEAFEQRAFGIFLRELSEHGIGGDDVGATSARAALERAASIAADAPPRERPGFSSLAAELELAAREVGYRGDDPAISRRDDEKRE